MSLGFSERAASSPHGRRAEMPLSDTTRQVVDEEVGAVAEAYRDAVELIRAHRPGLEALADALIGSEAIDRLEIETLWPPRRRPGAPPQCPRPRPSTSSRCRPAARAASATARRASRPVRAARLRSRPPSWGGAAVPRRPFPPTDPPLD